MLAQDAAENIQKGKISFIIVNNFLVAKDKHLESLHIISLA